MGRICLGGLGETLEGDMVKRVTVLMAVYNPPLDLLEEAIDSVLAQTYTDFEFLILDDGSTDATARAHLSRRARGDARIIVAWEPHRGLTPTLNRGLALASGEFIARQDADDWSAPERLERQVAHLEAHPECALVGSNAWMHQQTGRKLWRTRLPLTRAELLAAFPRGNPFVHGATMFRRARALELGGYREAFRCSQDYDFFWRMTERFEAANLAEPLYHYRYTRGSISAGRAAEQRRAHSAIRALAEARRQGRPEDPVAELERAGAEAESAGGACAALLKQADHIMLAGDRGGAARAYLRLLAAHPANPLAWAKLARLGVFCGVPFLREACFR
jgi:glycosyltransferase involved in cell wall biosynthesis